MPHVFSRAATRSTWLGRLALVATVLGTCLIGTAGSASAVANPCIVFIYPTYHIYGAACDVTTADGTAGVGANTYGSYDDWAGIPSFIADRIPANVAKIINELTGPHPGVNPPGAQAYFDVGLPIDDIVLGAGVGVDNENTVSVCDGPYYGTGLLSCHYYHPKLP